jgi:enediyne biosynthesis protein CalE5
MEAGSITEKADGRADQEQAVLRAHLHSMWSAVADGWAENAEYADARGAGLARRMLERAAPRPGERVLELACGPGGLGLAAAQLVAPDGEVVVSDVASEMTAIAAARAEALGLDNVTARDLDIEQIDEPDASYDVVLCREGFMFAADPARAASELERVLRPGGRFALAVWGPRERNPWLGIVFDAVTEKVGAPIPPPGVPGPFSLQDADRLARLLSGAGLADVTITEFPVPLRAGSFDEWWTRTSALAGPLAKILASLPDEAAHAIREHARAATRAYEVDGGLELPGVSLVASGARA